MLDNLKKDLAKTPTWKESLLGFIGLLLIISFLVVSCGGPSDQPKLVNAKPYTVIKADEGNHPRKSRTLILAPTALSQIERAETVKQAAMEIYAKESKAVTDVILEFDESAAGGGSWIARAIHYADGCDISGTECNLKEWEIQASKQQIKANEVAMYRVWQEKKNTTEFSKNEIIDEDKLTAYIAKQFKITPDQVTFPNVEPRENIDI